MLIAPTRGKCMPMDFLAGVRPKVWLSDRLPAQCTHAEAHQFCLAHLIRAAQYAIDQGDTTFAPPFKAFLKDACAVGQPDLADSTIATHRTHRRSPRSFSSGQRDRLPRLEISQHCKTGASREQVFDRSETSFGGFTTRTANRCQRGIAALDQPGGSHSCP
jgi:hypothetical protein